MIRVTKDQFISKLNNLYNEHIINYNKALIDYKNGKLKYEPESLVDYYKNTINYFNCIDEEKINLTKEEFFHYILEDSNEMEFIKFLNKELKK